MSEIWTEGDSETFLREADCFVPERELLIESICSLIPDRQGQLAADVGLIVELCCGDGRDSRA